MKKRYNPSAHKPTLVSNSGTGEIAIDNSKLLQPITEPEGTHQLNNIIDDPTAILLTVNTPWDIIVEDSKLPQYTGGYDN